MLKDCQFFLFLLSYGNIVVVLFYEISVKKIWVIYNEGSKSGSRRIAHKKAKNYSFFSLVKPGEIWRYLRSKNAKSYTQVTCYTFGNAVPFGWVLLSIKTKYVMRARFFISYTNLYVYF